ncbi:hypothetical protein [Idiomarina ramblicola]|nr:hypothetical protein [Idiomarina ramblicola]
MNILLGVLAVATLLSGCASAYYWYQSSKVMVMPMEMIKGELQPIPVESNPTEWIRAVYLGIEKAGDFNKKASVYTAIAVFLSVVASLISVLSASAT